MIGIFFKLALIITSLARAEISTQVDTLTSSTPAIKPETTTYLAFTTKLYTSTISPSAQIETSSSPISSFNTNSPTTLAFEIDPPLTSKIDESTEATTKLASILTVTPAILTEKVTDSLDTTVSQSTVIKQDNFETTIGFSPSIPNQEIKNLPSLSSTTPLLSSTIPILTSSKEVETIKETTTIGPSQTSAELSPATNKIELVKSTTLISFTDKVDLKSVSIPISIADPTTAIFITKTPSFTTTLPIASTKIIGQSSSTVLSETSTNVISSSVTTLDMDETSTPIQKFTTFLSSTTTTGLQNSANIISTSSLNEISSSKILPLNATDTQIIDSVPLTPKTKAITKSIPAQDTQSISYSTPNIKTTNLITNKDATRFLTSKIIDLTTFVDTTPSVSTTSTASSIATTTKITKNIESSKTSTFYSTPAITNSIPFSRSTITTPIQFISQSTTSISNVVSNREATEPSAQSITSTVGSLLIETTTAKQLTDAETVPSTTKPGILSTQTELYTLVSNIENNSSSPPTASIETEPKTTSLLTEKIQTYSSSTLSNFLVSSEIIESTPKITQQTSPSIENSILDSTIPISFLPTTTNITPIIDDKTTISNLELGTTTNILSLKTDSLKEPISSTTSLSINLVNEEKIENKFISTSPETLFHVSTPIAITTQTVDATDAAKLLQTFSQSTSLTTTILSSPEAFKLQTTKIERTREVSTSIFTKDNNLLQSSIVSITSLPITTPLPIETVQTSYSSLTSTNIPATSMPRSSEIIETTKLTQTIEDSILNAATPVTPLPTTPKIESTTSILGLESDSLKERTSFPSLTSSLPINLHLNQENGEKILTTSITPKTSFLILTSSITTSSAIKAQTSNDLMPFSTSFMVTRTTPLTTSIISSTEALASQTTKIESINLESTKKIIPTTSNQASISTSTKEIDLNTDSKPDTLTSTSTIRLSSTNLLTSYETATKIAPVSIENATFTTPSSIEMIQTSFYSLPTAIIPETIIENNANLKSDIIKSVTLLPATTKITSTIIDQTTLSHMELVTTNILSSKTNSILDKAYSTSTLRINSNLNELNEEKILTKSILSSTVVPMASLPIIKETELIPFTTATNPQAIQTLDEVMSTAKLFSTSQKVQQTSTARGNLKLDTDIPTTAKLTSAIIDQTTISYIELGKTNILNLQTDSFLGKTSLEMSSSPSPVNEEQAIPKASLQILTSSITTPIRITSQMSDLSPNISPESKANKIDDYDYDILSTIRITSNLNELNEEKISTKSILTSTVLPMASLPIIKETELIPFTTATNPQAIQTLDEVMSTAKLLSTSQIVSQTTPISTTISILASTKIESVPELSTSIFINNNPSPTLLIEPTTPLSIETVSSPETSIPTTFKIKDTTKIVQTSTSLDNMKPDTTILVTFSPTTTKIVTANVDEPTASNFTTTNLNSVNEIKSTNIPITSPKFSTASIALATQSLNEIMDNAKLLPTTQFISQTTPIATTVSSSSEALALNFDRSSLQTNKIENIIVASTSISTTSKILDTTTPQKVQQTSTTIGNLKPDTDMPTSTIIDQTTISYIEIGKTNILSLQTDSFLSKTSLEMSSSTLLPISSTFNPVNEEQAIPKASLQILTSSITTPIRITSQMSDLSPNISPESKANKIDDYDYDILSTPLSPKTETPFLIKSETSTSTATTLIYSSTTKLDQDIPIEKVISTTTKIIQEESLITATRETTKIALDNLSTSILQVITTTILPSTTKTIFINHAELETLGNSEIKIEPTYTLKIEPLTSISLPTITRNTLLLTKATEDNSNILTTTPNTGDILTGTDHSTLYSTSSIINAVKSAKKKTDQLEIVRNEKKQVDHSNKIHEKIFFCNFDNFEESFSSTNLAQFSVSSNGVLNIISNISASSNHITDITSIYSPTLTSKNCILPFSLGSAKKNFCALNQGSFQCLVQSPDIFDKCSLGKFLHARSLNGDPFNSTFDFNLKLKKLGLYKIKYFILFYCDQTECKNARDYIELNVLYTNKTNRSISERFYLSDVDQEYKWIEKSFEFLVTNQKETNLKISVNMGRLNYFDEKASLGFDHLDLELVEEFSNTFEDFIIEKWEKNFMALILVLSIPVVFIIILIIASVVIKPKKSHDSNLERSSNESISSSNETAEPDEPHKVEEPCVISSKKNNKDDSDPIIERDPFDVNDPTIKIEYNLLYKPKNEFTQQISISETTIIRIN